MGGRPSSSPSFRPTPAMTLRRTLLLAVLLAAVAPFSAVPVLDKASPRADGDEIDYRLPSSVVPEHYYLKILPDYVSAGLAEAKTYKGEIVIEAETKAAIREIVFHKGLPIKEVIVICVVDTTNGASFTQGGVQYVTKGDEGDDRLKSIGDFCSESDGVLLGRDGEEEDETTDKFTIKLQTQLATQRKIRIVLVFEAEFPAGGLTGFYVSTYEDENNNTKVGMLTTKFEPTYARNAFPCFDEPALKATFDLVINKKTPGPALGVISNRDEEKTYGDNILFQTSPTMPTYLLAFIVYEKDSFTSTDINPRDDTVTKFKTWGQKSVIKSQGVLSQIEGPASLMFLESYTGIPYKDTMTKMDMAAIPDFQTGAMENWGLVTYRESALLYENGTHTAAYKRVLDVIAHELVHMWFGNLVTTEWWSSIWLNEGFARYLQYLVVDDRYPNWRMLERFVIDEQMGVFASDASIGVSPLTDDTVKSPTQIGSHFSTISYSKGGAILRQIRNVMGEENFVEGVQKYLRERKLKSATPDQLFDFLVEFNNNTRTKLDNGALKTAMKGWTEKAGYPLVTVTRNGNSFTVKQERFLLSPDPDVKQTYSVYLTWATGKEDAPSEPKSPGEWLHEETITFTVEGLGSGDWILFNAYQGGYYRVNYGEGMWDQLERLLDKEDNLDKVAPVDRAALVDNALNLARAGVISYDRAFRVLRFLRHDTDFAPWAAARNALAHLERMVGQEDAYKEFIGHIVEKAFNDTGFETQPMDAHLEKVHRTNVLSLACSAGYEPCIEKAYERLQSSLKECDEEYNVNCRDKLEPDLESVVFCYGLKNDTGDLWEKVWAQYKGSNAARRAVLTTALGCIQHRDTLKRYLQESLDSEDVRSQDAYTLFSAVYANPEGVGVALDFLTFWGYEKLDKRYGAVRNAMITLVSGLANRLTTDKQLEQLKKAVEGYEERHTGALNTVRSNMAWLEKNEVPVISRNLDRARKFVVRSSAASVVVSLTALLFASLILFLR